MIHYSFDVFDTCITRVFARPTDLFFALARESLREAGKEHGPEDIADFAKIRQEAERRARKESPREDVRLEEIYAEAHGLRRWFPDLDTVLRNELKLEKRSMRPAAPILERIRALRGSGRPIVFISDMYLPGDYIRELLRENGFFEEGDRLYVSGELGITKRSGALFKHVLKDLGIKPGHLRHAGDHPLSDVRVPRKLGIKADFVGDTALNRHEARLAAERGPGEQAESRSLMAGISRCLRLSPGGESLALWSAIAGPMLLAYTAWVLRDAARRGIKKLYFVSRDGWILLHAAKALRQYVPGPECEYLYGSRQAWFAAAADPEKEVFFLEGQSRAVRDVLRRLNVGEEEFADIAGAEFPDWSRQLDDEGWARFRAMLREDVPAALIRKRAGESMDAAAAYMGEAGLAKSGDWALADIGWTLKTQAVLSDILKQAGHDGTVHAYYLGVTRDRVLPSSPGSYKAFFIQSLDGGFFARTDALFHWMTAVEQGITMAPHGSLKGYRRTDAGMELDTRDASMEVRAMAEGNAEFMTRLTDEYGRAGLLADETIDETIAVLRAFVPDSLDLIWREPTAADASAFAKIMVSDDQNEARAVPVCRPLGVGEFLRFVFKFTGGAQTDMFAMGFIWFRGSLALSNSLVRSLYKLAFQTRSLLARIRNRII